MGDDTLRPAVEFWRNGFVEWGDLGDTHLSAAESQLREQPPTCFSSRIADAVYPRNRLDASFEEMGRSYPGGFVG